MRRCGLIVASLGLALAAAGCGGGGQKQPTGVVGAAPASPVVSAAAPTLQKGTGYWTPARMRRAKPAELLVKRGRPPEESRVPAPEGPRVAVQPTAPRGSYRAGRLRTGIPRTQEAPGYPFPYTSYQWPGPTTDLPARTWGKVFFEAPDGDYVCSGTAVTSKNRSVVWTAGHCAADPDSHRFYTQWAFVPGYVDGEQPYGVFVGRRFFTTKAWLNRGDSSYDLAAVVVAPARRKKLTDVVGGQGISFNQPREEQYVSGGYPAADPFDGETLWLCEAPYGNSDPDGRPAEIAIGCNMTGGSSGGGWLMNLGDDGLGYLISVNSYGYLDEPEAMYGPYQGNIAHKLYVRASTARK